MSNKDSGGAVYLTLAQNLAMKSALITVTTKKKYKEEVLYDYSNPAVSTETLKKRMCVKCNLMFAAINMKETHQKWCTKKPRRTDDITQVIEESEASTSIEAASSSRPIRPARIKARRGLELLCLIENQLDWYDADEVDTDGLDIPAELSAEHGTPFLGDPNPIWIIDD